MAARGPVAALRAGDADRDRCVDQLGAHFAAGRLEHWELEDRVGRALVARTLGELDSLVGDCPRSPGPARMSPLKRAGACVAGLAAIVALAGGTGALASEDAGDLPTCVATGIAVPEDADCPVVSPQQERLMQDAARAEAAADQVTALQGSAEDHDRLRALGRRADAAAARARRAVADARLIVSAARDGRVGKTSLDAAARKARSAATDATRAAAAARTLAPRGS